ncbi:MAG: inorganic pyrophosphatase [Nitrospiraceae bacterium]
MKEKKSKGKGEESERPTPSMRGAMDPFQRLLGLMFKAHPWHGVPIGESAPELVTAYIEIVPTDTVKYEVDKGSGFLKIDRPQRFSNFCPAYYGLIPQTYCGEAVATMFGKRARRKGMVGDGDPLDICVLSEKSIPHSDILLTAVPIGGLSMADGGEADDKIIAVMRDDAVYGGYRDITDCPSSLLDRLQHYFLTYKSAPGSNHHKVEITSVYGRDEAQRVIRASHADYRAKYPELSSLWPSHL